MPRRREVDALVVETMPLARKIASRWFHKTRCASDRDDLISAAMLGLVIAARNYRRSKNDNFESFAQKRIAGAVQDYLREQDPLSRDMRAHLKRIGVAWEALGEELGRHPTEAEVAARLGCTVVQLAALRVKCQRPEFVEADKPVSDEWDEHLIGLLPSHDRPIDDVVADQLDAAAIVAELDDARRTVVYERFVEEIGLVELGARRGVTESRACQIVQGTVALMRELVTSEAA